MEPTDIELPAELLPTDGRFGSGPSKIRTESVLELAVTGSSYLGTSHRRPPVKRVVRRIREGLGDLFRLPDDYEVVLGIGGATAFWDAATFSLIRRRSAHAVFGEFSGKFAAATSGAPFLEDPIRFESEPGTRPDVTAVDGVDAYALTQNETSTGVMAPVFRPAPDALVLVDATSAAGGMPIDPATFDAYYFSPQKAFGAEGGLWVALMSPAALARIEEIEGGDRWIPPFSSLATAVANSRKDQTYNTPALATLFFLQRQVEWLLDMGGLGWATKRCATSAGIVYAWAERADYARPFVARPEDRSTTVTTVELDGSVSAEAVSAVLRANGIVDTEGYRKLGGNQLRIATFPNIEPGDVERLTGAIDYIVERLT